MVRFAIILLTLCASAVLAADPAVQPGTPGAEEPIEQLKAEAESLRRELAAAKLELRKALRELQEIKDFLASEDPRAEAERWREERSELADERRRLETERRKLEAERRRIQRAIINNEPPPPPPGLDPQSPEPDPALEPDPELEYKLAYVRTGADGVTTYIEFGDLLIPANTTPSVDRNHVIVRGTIQNRSKAPWRYTFEVRLADRPGNIIGRRRYQTPLLGPNELHPFDIDMAVTDSLSIDRYQIGNLEADQPEE